MRYMMVPLAILILAVPAVARPDMGLVDGSGGSTTAAQSVVRFQFMTFVQNAMPEQDVYIERDGLAADLVMRIDPAEIKGGAILSKALYASTKANVHDTHRVTANPLGPFPKGLALGFTLGQWLSARGVGTYSVTGDSALIDVSFRRLVSDGLYSLWCVPSPGRPPGQLPCGAMDGTENTFHADASGNGSLRVRTRLLPPGGVIAIAYHSDGLTYGQVPGELGRNAHIHLVFFLPDWIQTSQ